MSSKRKLSSSSDAQQDAPPTKKQKSTTELDINIIQNDEPYCGLPEDCIRVILEHLDYPALLRAFFVSKRIYSFSLAIFNNRIQNTYAINPENINGKHVNILKEALSEQSFFYSIMKLYGPKEDDDLYEEIASMQYDALTQLQRYHIRTLAERISPLLRPLLDRIVVIGVNCPYIHQIDDTDLDGREMETCSCDYMLTSQTSKYTIIECFYYSDFSRIGIESTQVDHTAYLEDFNIKEEGRSCNLFFEPYGNIEANERIVRTLFRGNMDLAVPNQSVIKVLKWMDIKEISLDPESESQAIFRTFLAHLMKPISEITRDQVFETLGNERISLETMTTSEILTRLLELCMKDDQESWQKIYAIIGFVRERKTKTNQ